MGFTPSTVSIQEVRKVAIVQKTDGSFTVNATRSFYTGTSENFKLPLDGEATDVESALQAVQAFMRTGSF